MTTSDGIALVALLLSVPAFCAAIYSAAQSNRSAVAAEHSAKAAEKSVELAQQAYKEARTPKITMATDGTLFAAGLMIEVSSSRSLDELYIAQARRTSLDDHAMTGWQGLFNNMGLDFAVQRADDQRLVVRGVKPGHVYKFEVPCVLTQTPKHATVVLEFEAVEGKDRWVSVERVVRVPVRRRAV